MRAQRPAHLAVAINAVAENLPFDDDSFDAAMAMVTVHQWPDADRGLRELRRVSRGPVVILTFDAAAIETFWLAEYVPDLLATEQHRFPPFTHLVDVLGGSVSVTPVPIPIDCVDGFVEAFYARPEQFLDPAVRAAQSAWSFVAPEVAKAGLARLRADLESGEWDRRHGALRSQPQYLGSLYLVTANSTTPTAGTDSAP